MQGRGKVLCCAVCVVDGVAAACCCNRFARDCAVAVGLARSQMMEGTMGVASSPVTLAARWWWCIAWPNVVGMGSAAIALAASRRDNNIMSVVVPATESVCALHL
jgi:hypothetical protein